MQLRGKLSLRTLIGLVLILGAIAAGAFWGGRMLLAEALNRLETLLAVSEATQVSETLQMVHNRLGVLNDYLLWVVMAAFGFLILLLWGVLSLAFSGPVKRWTASAGRASGKAAVEAPVQREEFVRDAEDTGLVLLSLLQKEGRFLDFLNEDLDGYEDHQIGAAVRSVHEGCNKAIRDHVRLAPVMDEAEGGIVRVEEPFDRASVKLTGNVKGRPPFQGTLRHPGWRVIQVSWPSVTSGHDASVVAPAEVEIE